MLDKSEQILGGIEEARAIVERVHNPVSSLPLFVSHPLYVLSLSLIVPSFQPYVVSL